MTRHLEADQQKLVVAWMRRAGLKFFAVPNGAYLFGSETQRVRQWAKMLAMGASVGVPDLCIVSKAANGQPTFLEMKRDSKSKPSDDQMLWLADLRALGYNAVVGNGADDAIAKLVELGYGRRVR